MPMECAINCTMMDVEILVIISDPAIVAVKVAFAAETDGMPDDTAYTYTITGYNARGSLVANLTLPAASHAFSSMLDFMITAAGYTRSDSYLHASERVEGVLDYTRR